MGFGLPRTQKGKTMMERIALVSEHRLLHRQRSPLVLLVQRGIISSLVELSKATGLELDPVSPLSHQARQSKVEIGRSKVQPSLTEVHFVKLRSKEKRFERFRNRSVPGSKKTNPAIANGNCEIGIQVTQSDDAGRQSGKARTEPHRTSTAGARENQSSYEAPLAYRTNIC
jgi:hypothetical protein